jgi:hypothetical protein
MLQTETEIGFCDCGWRTAHGCCGESTMASLCSVQRNRQPKKRVTDADLRIV